jgi:hypothetical protein
MAQRIDVDTPIPLILEQLTGTLGWQMMCERVDDEINRVENEVTRLSPDTSAQVVQRLLGQIESLRWFKRQDARMRSEYDRAVKTAKTATGAIR